MAAPSLMSNQHVYVGLVAPVSVLAVAASQTLASMETMLPCTYKADPEKAVASNLSQVIFQKTYFANNCYYKQFNCRIWFNVCLTDDL
jgi:hypothetical protein